MNGETQIVTLITDFGTTDYYAGMVKGAIMCQYANTYFADITHNVKSFDIVQAAFILKNAYSSFPKGTIHITSVNNFYSKTRKIIAFENDGHYFIGPDNGIFSLVFGKNIKVAYQLSEDLKTAFSFKNAYANAVKHIATKQPIETIGQPVNKILQRITLQPVINRYQVMGSIIHIDNYENCVVNVNRELFDKIRGKRKFAIFFKRNITIIRLSNHYCDVPVGEILCLFNSANYLEIAVNMGKASTLLGLNIEDTVQIDFI